MTMWDLSQKSKVGLTYESQSVKYTIFIRKRQNHTTISIHGEKFYKIHFFMLKTLNKYVTIVHKEKSKESTKNYRWINEFSKVGEYQVNKQKSISVSVHQHRTSPNRGKQFSL